MKISKQDSSHTKPLSAKTELLPELKTMSKQELKQLFHLLQAEIFTPTDLDSDDYLTHELQVHQIELEMQNRELREAQQEIEIARDRYADLYDFAPVTYISFDGQGVIKNINLTGAKILDAPRANLMDRPFLKWIDARYLNTFFNHLRKTLQVDIKTSTELQIISQYADIIDVRMESVRSWSPENNCFLCQSIILDITENKLAQNEISRQTRQLKLITDSLPLQIAYLNMEEQHIFVNKPFADWLEVSIAELIGKPASEAWDETIYLEIKKYLNMALLGQHSSFDMEFHHPENAKQYVCATLIPDLDSENQVHGVIVLIGDTTEQLALEVVDRQRLLDAVHFSRLSIMGQMASEIAHELNQPLAAISIYSDACRRMLELNKTDPNKIIQTLADIRGQAERAGEIIKRIREFVSKKDVQLVKTSINTLISESLQLLKVELRSHQVQLILDLEKDLPKTLADRILIEQVVHNLSRNAIEAMDSINHSKRILKITTSAAKSGGIEVNIKDSGAGMNVDQLKQVFEPFHTTKVNGMGLGLVICQSIIDAHQGRLWAVSNEHTGTIFSFTLPLISEEDIDG